MSEKRRESKILTVTVPAYNAEGFLCNCLDSLCLPEILPDLEVLVINDGSADSTAQIAEEYERRFPGTVRLISKENGGHGSGINCGIANASGRYFKVVDADDWVERDGFLKLISSLKKLSGKQTDVVFSNFCWVYEVPDVPKEKFERKTELAEPFAGVRYEKIYRFDDIAGRLYIKMHNMTIRTAILKNMEEAERMAGTDDGDDKLNGSSETVTNIENSGSGGCQSEGVCREPDGKQSGKPLRMDEHCFYVDTEYVTYPIPFVETIYFLKEYVYNYRIGRQGQSVGMERMRRNERDYDRVLESLLSFYDRLEEPETYMTGAKDGTAFDQENGKKVKNTDLSPALHRSEKGGSKNENGAGEIPCSAEKKNYISNMIARVAAAKIKIMLSFPASAEKKRELAAFDRRLKEQYPEIYQSNINGAVKALRASGYLLYRPAAWMVKKKYND